MNTQNVYTYAIQYQKFKLIYPHNMKDSENTTNYISMMYIKQSNSKNKQINKPNPGTEVIKRWAEEFIRIICMHSLFGKIKSIGNTS